MSFIDTSVITNTSNTLGGVSSALSIAKSQSAVSKTVSTLSTVASKSIVSALGVSNPLAGNVAPSLLSTSLSSAVGALTKSFGVDPTGLAKGLDSALSGVFKDTNVKTASTVSTAISDPTASLLAKLPNSAGFKLTSSEAGSQLISSSGSTTDFGSKATSLIGTNLSTVTNRFNLDSVNNIGNTITNSNLTTGLKGLFSNVSSVVKQVGSVAKTAITISNTINRSTGSSLYGNDTQVFLNKVGNLSSALSGTNMSQYVLSSTKNTLMDSSGTIIDTNSTGIDATTANLIASVANLAGCNIPVGYQSYSANASYFNTSLNLAVRGGMTSLVTSLVNCAMGNTTLGQQALSNSFNTSLGSVVSLASTIISKINSPESLNTANNRQTLLTNASLTASDSTLVESIFNTMGTTTVKALSVESVSSDACPVLDYSTLTKATPSFLNGATGSSTISNFLNGKSMTLDSSGMYTVVN
jgi:hypothetical protein